MIREYTVATHIAWLHENKKWEKLWDKKDCLIGEVTGVSVFEFMLFYGNGTIKDFLTTGLQREEKCDTLG